MTFSAYIIRRANGHYYTGDTDDLERRTGQHHSGELQGYTQAKRPIEFMWSAEFPTRAEAIATEVQVGGWSCAKKDAMFRGDWDGVGQAVKNARHASLDPPPRQARRLLETIGRKEPKRALRP